MNSRKQNYWYLVTNCRPFSSTFPTLPVYSKRRERVLHGERPCIQPVIKIASKKLLDRNIRDRSFTAPPCPILENATIAVGWMDPKRTIPSSSGELKCGSVLLLMLLLLLLLLLLLFFFLYQDPPRLGIIVIETKATVTKEEEDVKSWRFNESCGPAVCFVVRYNRFSSSSSNAGRRIVSIRSSKNKLLFCISVLVTSASPFFFAFQAALVVRHRTIVHCIPCLGLSI